MWQLFISTRYLLAKRREKFISIISIISILGVAVGVAALIIVLSIMTGFDEEIKERIIGTYAHVVVVSDDGIKDAPSMIKLVKQDPDVVNASGFIETQAIIRTNGKMLGVIMRGMDGATEDNTTNLKQFTSKKKLDLSGNNIILGSELMKNLGLAFGEEVVLTAPQTKKTMSFIVSDSFSSGRYDYDANIVLVGLHKAKEILNTANVTGIGLKVKNEFKVTEVKKRLQKRLGFTYGVRTWMDLDKNLMKALAMEKRMMFIVLGLIVIVACLNISSSLIMMVMEKTKDIGILRALGATSMDVAWIFLMNGLFIGCLGTGLGASCGIMIAKNINPIAGVIEKLTGYELFPKDIYYLSSIPSKIVFSDCFAIVGFAVLLTIVSGIYPALQAARLDPVEAIRYE